MSQVKIQGNASGTGIFTIASPATNTNQTLTLPDNTGTFLTTGTAGVPVNGPAFSAYLGTNQSLSANTATKLNFDTERFDTNSNYSTADKRFTPLVGGYYQVNITFIGGNSNDAIVILYKNGAEVSSASSYATATGARPNHSNIVYMNGSTDYIEAYGYTVSATTLTAGSVNSSFSAALVRSA